jgi:hypothetical protein
MLNLCKCSLFILLVKLIGACSQYGTHYPIRAIKTNHSVIQKRFKRLHKPVLHIAGNRFNVSEQRSELIVGSVAFVPIN